MLRVQRRTFLHMCGLSVVIYGCGSDSASFANFTGGATPNPPVINPALARTSTEGIFAFDAQGNLYEVRPQTGKVLRFDGQGRTVWTAGQKGHRAGQLDFPVALAIDGQQRVWVLDRSMARFQLFNSQGIYQGTFAEGLLNLPQDMVVDATRLYVSDGANQRVAVFDLAGAPVTEFGSALLNFPRGLALDASGRLHVVDSGNGQVLVLSAAGAQVASYGGPGPGQGKFRHARGIAIRAQDGLIAIADGVEGDIEFFSQDLVSLGFLTTPALQPRDLTFGPGGELYVHGDAK